MKFRFDNKELEEIYQTGKSKKYSPEVIRMFFVKMRIIASASNENDLRSIKGNHFEKLTHQKNLYSIRLNKQFRLEFTFTEDNQIKILLIQNISKHYE